MEKLTKAICVWLDQTSDCDEPAWIVSLDMLNEQGEAEGTQTLRVFGETEESQAYAEARRQARKRSLPLYENADDSSAVLIQDVSVNDD